METTAKRLAQGRKKKSQMGKSNYDPGAHMYHAATGVADGHKDSGAKRHRLKKAFSRMREYGLKRRDEGTHHYAAETA